MGDRATVLFFDRRTVSPAVYLHWHGSVVPELLGELGRVMESRRCDAAYAAARFVGLCHERIPGNLSLGVESTSLTLASLRDADLLTGMSPGNAGLVIVNTADFTWHAHGGYLSTSSSGTTLEAPPEEQNALHARRFDQVLAYSNGGGSDQEGLIDLLADSMHWCDARGEDFHIALAQASRHYIHELNNDQHYERRIRP